MPILRPPKRKKPAALGSSRASRHPAAAPLPPPAPSVFDAVRRYWWLLAILALIGVGGGVIFGFARTPLYTAESRLNVGRVNVSTQSIPGFQQAALVLADSYSRAIVGRQVVSSVEQKTGLSANSVANDLTAVQIPQTNIVRVLGEASSEAAAVKLSVVGSKALIAYVGKLNGFDPQSQTVLKEYRKAVSNYAAAKAALPAGQQPNTDPAVSAAKLKLRTIGGVYATNSAGQAAPNTLQALALATTAGSDRGTILQRAIFAGALAGLIAGTLLAIPMARRRVRRGKLV